MQKDFDRIVNPDYACFEQATDSNYMRPRLEKTLQRFWGKHVTFKEFAITRVLPRGKNGFAIQYYVVAKNLNGFPEKKIYLYGHLLGPSEPWAAYVDPENPKVLVMKNLHMVVPVFPFDPKLKYLYRFYEHSQTPYVLKLLQPHLDLQDNKLEFINHEILGYRLERRCVIRYTLGHQNKIDGKRFQIIAKIFRPGYSKNTTKLAAVLAKNVFNHDADDSFTIPHVYYSDDDMGVVFMETAPGKMLHSLFESSIFIKACAAAGKLLCKFHSFDAKELVEYSYMNELANFRNRFKAAIKIYPLLTEQFTNAFEILSQTPSFLTTGFVKVCSHRDFYDKQVLYSPERVTLLDYDNMAKADAALDYSNFMAHLTLRRLQFPDESRRIKEGMKAFALSYDSYDKDFAQRAHWWRAAALLRLAILYSLRPSWKSLVPDLLDEANKALKQMEYNSGGTDTIDSI